MLQQLMERIFGYNAGVEKGHTAKKHKKHTRAGCRVKGECGVKAGEGGGDYIANGRPPRTIKFENQVVHWEDSDNGIYRSFLAEPLPWSHLPPPAADSCGFCLKTIRGKCVSVPAAGRSEPLGLILT